MPVRKLLPKTCPIGCKPAGGLAPVVGWSFATIALVTLGGVVWWKWNQIGQSGVPLGFAMKRTFSRNFLEGSRGLVAAWEAKQDTQQV